MYRSVYMFGTWPTKIYTLTYRTPHTFIPFAMNTLLHVLVHSRIRIRERMRRNELHFYSWTINEENLAHLTMRCVHWAMCAGEHTSGLASQCTITYRCTQNIYRPDDGLCILLFVQRECGKRKQSIGNSHTWSMCESFEHVYWYGKVGGEEDWGSGVGVCYVDKEAWFFK